MGDNTLRGIGFAGILSLIGVKACYVAEHDHRIVNEVAENLAHSGSQEARSAERAGEQAGEHSTTSADNEQHLETSEVPHSEGPSGASDATTSADKAPTTSHFSTGVLDNETLRNRDDDKFADSLAKDATFISIRANDQYRVAGSNTKTYQSITDIPLNPHEPVIVDGGLTSREINGFHEKGITFVYNKQIYEQQRDITQYRIILVYSDDPHKLKDLYDLNDAQAADVISTVGGLAGKRDVEFADSEDALQDLLKNDLRIPVVIFHNKDNTLFNHPLSYYSIFNAITCKSAQFDNIFLKTTDFIGVSNTILSLPKTHAETLQGFYQHFTTSYNAQIDAQHSKTVLVVVGGGVILTGGVGGIYYFNKPQKNG